MERVVDPAQSGATRSANGTLRRTLKSGVFRIAKTGFAAADLVLGDWPGPRILIYHQIGSGTKGQMDVPASVFERQIDWLGERGRFARLEDALGESGSPEGDRTWVLTFDDGYEDVYRNAYPLLSERRIPFTLYLTTERMESRKPYDNGASPLQWSQVSEMVNSGLVTIGAHTHSHPDLRHLSREEIATELNHSNQIITERTGFEPRHFCYPKGYWSAIAEPEIVARYDTATLGAGSPVTAATNPYRIHRVAVQRSDGFAFFQRKIAKGMRLEEATRRAIKGYDMPSPESELVNS